MTLYFRLFVRLHYEIMYKNTLKNKSQILLSTWNNASSILLSIILKYQEQC